MTDPLIRFVTSVCVQIAVYWGTPVSDGYGGINFDDSVEIKCRWDGKIQMVKGSDGREVVSKAELLITQDVDEGGYLYLGTLDNLDSGEEDNPITIDGAWEILVFTKNPLFKSSTEFVRQAFL